MAKAKKKPESGKRKSAGPSLDWIIEPLRTLAVPIDEVKLDPGNENTHDEASINAIAASLKRFTQRTALVVNRKTKRIAKGNGNWLAAKQLGWTHIAVVFVDDDPKTHAGYRLADNRTAELSEWDQVKLAESLAELNEHEPDLAEALQLAKMAADLELAGSSTVTFEASDDASPEVPFGVLVECTSKSDQDATLKEFEAKGLICRPYSV